MLTSYYSEIFIDSVAIQLKIFHFKYRCLVKVVENTGQASLAEPEIK